jgi:hypothetical protein
MGVLCVGMAAALTIYARADPEPEDDAWPTYTKRYERQMEVYGGKANVLAGRLREWFEGLWHGRALGYTVGSLSILCAGMVYIALTPLPPEGVAAPAGGEDAEVPKR